MKVVDLATHTSGLTYGFMMRIAVDAAYRKAKVADRQTAGGLPEMVDQLAQGKLRFALLKVAGHCRERGFEAAFLREFNQILEIAHLAYDEHLFFYARLPLLLPGSFDAGIYTIAIRLSVALRSHNHDESSRAYLYIIRRAP